jgi:hypothetical protein
MGLGSVWVRGMRNLGEDSSRSRLVNKAMRGRCRDLKAVLRKGGLSCNALNSLPTGQNGNDKRH